MTVTHRRARLWALLLAAGLLWPAAGRAAESPDGKVIADVIVHNARTHSPEQVRAHLSQLRPGRAFSQDGARSDVQKLYATKWFIDGGVRIDARPTDDGRVLVYVQVVEVPNVIEEVVFRGAQHLSDKELREVSGLRKGVPLNPVANEIACASIVRRYQEAGRYFSSANLVEGNKPGDTRVVIDIVEGPVVKIRGVQFRGNHAAWTARLKQQLTAKPALMGLVGGTFTPAQAEFDRQRVVDYYRTLGYLGARVGEPVLEWSDDYRGVTLLYYIEEGPQYQVRNVQIEGAKIFKETDLATLVEAKPGGKYDRNVIQADMARIKALYGNAGYAIGLQERVYEVPDSPGEVRVHYEVAEPKPLTPAFTASTSNQMAPIGRPDPLLPEPDRVGNIIIEGNTVTRDNVIRRQMQLQPGQILTYPDIRASEANLARLGIFKMQPDQGIVPTVEVLPSNDDSPFKDILVRVQEDQTGSFLLGVGVNSDAGLSGSIVLNERNFDITRVPTSFEEMLSGRAFRGAGQELRLEAVPGSQFQRYSISFREPYLFDSQFGFGASGYFFQRSFAEYNEDRVGGRFNIDRRLDPIWRATVATRVESVNIYDVSFFAPQSIRRDVGESFLLGLSGGVTRDTRDSYLRPTTGSQLDLRYEQVLGTYTFPIGTAEFVKYWTTYERYDGSGKHVLAARSQLSVAGDDAPVFERFYAGGFRSLRGFSFRGVGPQQNGFFTGGRFAFVNSLEYQIPVVASDKLYFVSFLDHGTVEENVSIRDYRVAAGVGARIVVPMLGPVPIALDFGFPLNRAPGDNRQMFSFWLGFFN